MANIEKKRFDSPDEVRHFTAKGLATLLNLGPVTVGRGVFEPGWRWSEHVKPLQHTDSCEAEHLGLLLSGKMHVVMNDGEEADLLPGEVVHIRPGHDAWVVGNETCVFLDFTGMRDYARARTPAGREGEAAAPAH